MDDAKLKHLAYAAFHCSSLRALALSTSDCETKREPTAPVEIEGMASSAMMENPRLDPGLERLSAPPHSAVQRKRFPFRSDSGHG